MAGLFTIVMDTYYRPALLREAVEALSRQTYGNLEIILVNNGAIPETVEYLHQVEKEDRRVKLVHFHENQFSYDDPLKMVDVCLNAGLRLATGDYVWYQSDDDLIADDYVEKMVALFRDNPNCLTAAGLPVGIDIGGAHLEDPSTRSSNRRPRYMSGYDLALGVARGDRSLFSAPGTVFTIRREALVRAGGFHRCIELSHLFGIVPFGITGFDETARFFWRRHEGQLNKQLSASGWVGIDEQFDMLREWELERRWQKAFGGQAAALIVGHLTGSICRTAANWFALNLAYLRLRAAWRILSKIWRQPRFWRLLPGQLAIRLRQRLFEVAHQAVPQSLQGTLKSAIRGVRP